jgi:PAS domain S-box-containing protein
LIQDPARVSSTPRHNPGSAFARPLLRYGLALLSVGLSVLLMRGLGQLGGAYDDRPALLVAIAVSTLYGGLGPGLVALGFSLLMARDLVLLVAGVVLAFVCSRFARSAGKPQAASTPKAPDSLSGVELAPSGQRSSRASARKERDLGASSPPLLEVTTEATWRFHHEQPLDITLPEDEQVEHLYLYSILAECNDAFARMYGFRAAADVVGTRLVVFLPPSNAENVAYLRSFIRSGYRLEDAESHEIDRYGHSKYFVNNLVGIFERGQLTGAWGTQRDVTELRRAEEPQEYSSRLHSTKSSSQ